MSRKSFFGSIVQTLHVPRYTRNSNVRWYADSGPAKETQLKLSNVFTRRRICRIEEMFSCDVGGEDGLSSLSLEA